MVCIIETRKRGLKEDNSFKGDNEISQERRERDFVFVKRKH